MIVPPRRITLCTVCIFLLHDAFSFVPNRPSRPFLPITSSSFSTSTTKTVFGERSIRTTTTTTTTTTRRSMSEIVTVIYNDGDDDDDDDDDDDEEEDPYRKIAASEFVDAPPPEEQEDKDASTTTIDGGELVTSSPFLAQPPEGGDGPTTDVDWGGALGKLRQRVDDAESGLSQDPSHALFRLMSAPSPSQQIASFLNNASPQVVQAMTGAVGSLLGGLAQPMSGVDVVVKASGERMGNLCFQLQMTGYMFRNAEYVMALQDLMKLKGSATLQDYKDAFDDIDRDGNGYIDASEIRDLLDTVYEGEAPEFEVEAFFKFFDANQDGKVTWDEFERGLGSAVAQRNGKDARTRLLGSRDSVDPDDDVPDLDPDVVGTIEIELEDGKVVEVEAKEYIDSLKEEARALKAALRRETPGVAEDRPDILPGMSQPPMEEFGNIADYIAKRQGDIKSLTEGISPEIVETMKKLVDFVLDGGSSGKARKDKPKEEMEMQLPSSALQQLALWQLVLGYRLREAEAKGDYFKLLDE